MAGNGAKCDWLASVVWTALLAVRCLLSCGKSLNTGLFFLKGTFVGSLEDTLLAHVQTSTLLYASLCVIHTVGNSHTALSLVPSFSPWCPLGSLEHFVQACLPCPLPPLKLGKIRPLVLPCHQAHVGQPLSSSGRYLSSLVPCRFPTLVGGLAHLSDD